MIIYIILGLIWSLWLEYYTTSYIQGEYGSDWSWFERVFHLTLWPYSLIVFLYNLFKS
jgi:hypothetical protein